MSSADFTAGIFIINNKKEILVTHATNSPFSTWGIPKGLVDKGESHFEAALREVEEETGIKIIGDGRNAVHHLGNMPYKNGNKILVAYYVFLKDVPPHCLIIKPKKALTLTSTSNTLSTSNTSSTTSTTSTTSTSSTTFVIPSVTACTSQDIERDDLDNPHHHSDQDRTIDNATAQATSKTIETIGIDTIDVKKLWCSSMVTPKERDKNQTPFPEVDVFRWIPYKTAEKQLYQPQKAILPKLVDLLDLSGFF